MDKCEVTLADLEHLAAAMAQALANLQCPEHYGPAYGFIEVGAKVYQEEWEWAFLAVAIMNARSARKAGKNRL
jgi:hypothetical protein